MITSITFGPVCPPGRYSSGTCGRLVLVKPRHPATPSREAPAAPVPAPFKKSLRVNVLLAFLLKPSLSPKRWPRIHTLSAGAQSFIHPSFVEEGAFSEVRIQEPGDAYR